MKVEAKDNATGAFYYYNETTGNSQWERPNETSLCGKSSSSSVHLPENWVEALDETSGAVYTEVQHCVIVFFSI